ncbi:MAG: 50S ribosomal protein L24, partial [Gallicola sp.]|nr:50S ribosomal protein L24 [Gallicola sp.]
IIEGLNMITKHMKAKGPNQPGGIQKMEAPIHVSNVMYYENGKGTKLGYKISGDKKVRVSKRTDKEIK